VANVNELITSAEEYDRDNPEGSLDDYLTRVSLVSDVDHLDPGGGSVTLMTLHAAKGLEFPVVAILGLEDGILPHERGLTDPNQMEEERRLCFVGVTRAEQRLMLSRAASRMVRGETRRSIVSRFIYEMPMDRLDAIELSGDRTDSFSSGSSSSSSRSGRAMAQQFPVGQRVRSVTFGLGTVVELTDSGSGQRVEVLFDKSGRKRLIVEHARLEAVADDQRSSRADRRGPK
jgi:DNA helicase-2/ATP-dependent DNA helicase PcrA